MQRNEAILLDIARAARLARDFVAGMTKEEFLADLKTQSAVLYQLLVLGEAVKRLSGQFRSQHPSDSLVVDGRNVGSPDSWI